MGAIEPLVLDRDDVADLMPSLAEIVDLASAVYRESANGAVEVPTKIGIRPDRPLSFLHAMPAWLGARREIGMKWVSYFPGSDATPESDATAVMILNDPDSGLPVAIMEGMHFTNARTAASGIFAAGHLAPVNPVHIGLIGCGALQSWTLPELARLYPSMKSASVTSRRTESRNEFALRLSAETGVSVSPVNTVKEAVESADIVVSAIPQGPPPVAQGAWLKPGALVIAYDILGTWDDAALARFGLLATDGLPRLENIIATQRTSASLPDHIVSFDDLAANDGVTESSNQDKPVLAVPSGVASLDVALAWEIYRRAEFEGRGHRIKLL